jgi:hypothetical protein
MSEINNVSRSESNEQPQKSLYETMQEELVEKVLTMHTYRGEKRKLYREQVRADPDLHPRAEMDEQWINNCMESLDNLAPVRVFEDEKGVFWLADGFHTHEAFRRAKRKMIPADVSKGSRRDALRYALSANARHGLPRSNKDKRKVVNMALDDPEWSGWCFTAIADLCAVSHTLVSNINHEREAARQEAGVVSDHDTGSSCNGCKLPQGEGLADSEVGSPSSPISNPPSRKKYLKGGEVRSMDTTRIGRGKKGSAAQGEKQEHGSSHGSTRGKRESMESRLRKVLPMLGKLETEEDRKQYYNKKLVWAWKKSKAQRGETARKMKNAGDSLLQISKWLLEE